MSASSLKQLIYTGPSMNPTLKTGDMLYIFPYNNRKVRRGDVVVYQAPGGERRVTHRVISVDSGVIRTLGDNNSHVDDYNLTRDDLIGRVVYARRRRVKLRIYGGIFGRLFAAKVRAIHSIKLFLLSSLRPLYHCLAKSGILERFVFPHMKTRIVLFKRPNGIEKQLLLGQRVIGRYIPGRSQWRIRPPFRLFIDVASLPREDQES